MVVYRPLIILSVFLALCVLGQPTFSQENPVSAPEGENTAPPPDISEYNDIPEGLLIDLEKLKKENGGEGSEPAIDTTIIPSFYKPIGSDTVEDTHENDPQTTRTMTIEEIVSRYKKGKYAEIKETLESMVQYSSHEAEELLGIMYLYGQGVEKDPKRALDLLTKAAEAGRPLAGHHLGVMYFTGQGMEIPDEITALMWLHLAILHYSDGPEKDRAQADRDGVFSKLNRHDRQQAMDLVKQWLEKKGEEHLIDLQ